jgi:peptidoglycan/LPS O-acetylase OafA/YrhL
MGKASKIVLQWLKRWYISQNVDYFNQFAIEPLKHLWSLAIEEQFYLLVLKKSTIQ